MPGKAACSRSRSASSERSAAKVSTRTWRAARTASAAVASVVASREARMTSHPSAAKASAQARPMPFDPPVTRTVLP